MANILATSICEPARRRGLSIFPIRPQGKEPIVSQRQARPDYPIEDGQNYGVVATDTVCILDIDSPELFAAVCPELPETYTVKSRRGLHLYFKQTDASRRLGNTSRNGVFDFMGGFPKYCVGEGSIHPSGCVYECLKDVDLAAIPDGLVQRLSSWPFGEGIPGFIPDHRKAMLSLCGRLWVEGKDRDVLLEEMLAANVKADVPLSVGDVTRMVDYAVKEWELAVQVPQAYVGKDTPIIEVLEKPAEKWECRLDLPKTDYLDMLAEEITIGTQLPFSYARETFKMLLLACVPKLPTFPWFRQLHSRQYVVLLSDEPGVGKGETWRRCTKTLERSGFPQDYVYQTISGAQLGSPEYAVKKFGAEISRGTPKEPGIVIQIVRPKPIVHYDEGKQLAQKDADRGGLVTMFTSLFDSNEHSFGSFKNGEGHIRDANVSLMLHFVQDAFDLTFNGTGVTTDGFLSRCTFVLDRRNIVSGHWRNPDSQNVERLMTEIRACMTKEIDPSALAKRHAECVNEIRTWEKKLSGRLEFLFTQDLMARVLFAPSPNPEAVDLAFKWTKHQYETRRVVYPIDVSKNKAEQMGFLIRTAFEKHGPMTKAKVQDRVNVRRIGSGGWTVFKQVWGAMPLKVVAKTHKGTDVYDLADRE